MLKSWFECYQFWCDYINPSNIPLGPPFTRNTFGFKQFYHLTFYKSFMLTAWRIKTRLWYPIRFHLLPKLSYKHYKSPRVPRITDEELEKSMAIPVPQLQMVAFPMEIWYEISKYMNRGKLIRINKTFCEFFSAYIYSDIQMILTLNYSKKIRKNDSTYIHYGPDFFDHKIDDFEIYKRYQEGKRFEFEILDATLRDELESKIDVNDYKIIYKYSEIKNILTHVINNPNSYLKRYVNQVNFDVSVLSSFFHIVEGDHSLIGRTLIEISASDSCSVMSMFAMNIMSCMYFSDAFGRNRWHAPNLTSSYNADFSNGRLMDPQISKDVYPRNVYMKELLTAGLFQRFIRNKEKRNFMRMTWEDQLTMAHYERLLTPDRLADQIDWRELIYKAAAVQSSVAIESRVFESKANTEALIINTMDSMCDNQCNGNISCSIMFVGQDCLDLDELTFSSASITTCHPATYVINKPKVS